MQKWEYCFLTGIKSEIAGFAVFRPMLLTFTVDGCKTVFLGNAFRSNREINWKDKSEPDYVGHVIAKLGLDGWELIATAIDEGETHRLYFRRPVKES